jgi:uncharacterized protein YecE (DUF72 family)
LVYSDDEKLHYLKEYAKKYDTVEIDQWFWSLHGPNKITLPRSDVVEDYRRSVPSHFRFTVKIPNSVTLTHHYRRNKNDPLIPNTYFLSADMFHRFLETIHPLADYLGPLMFQFEYLNKQKMSSQTEFQDRFESFISRCPKEFLYGVEIRNPNYMNGSYFAFLNRNRLHHVFLQGYYMPPITDVYAKHTSGIRGTTVIRLHGPDRKGIERKSGGRWNRIVEPKDDELDGVAKMVENLIKSDVDVWLNVNNHYEGSAPLTIERINKRLKTDAVAE